MGASQSSDPAAIAAIAAAPAAFRPPLGPPNPANPLVYFDVSLNRTSPIPLGRVVIELKEDVTPKTAANFLALCEEPTVGKGFVGSRFHRIIPSFMCQGGDFTRDDGTGGRSIYGTKFPDENFKLRHGGPGVLSMANSGPNTNGSQFFLCVAATSWLDGKHVVFGQVVEGYGIVKAMEACGAKSGDTSFDVMISGCGVMPASASAPTGFGGKVSASATGTRSFSSIGAATPLVARRLPGRAVAPTRCAAAPVIRLPVRGMALRAAATAGARALRMI